ncbi:MAG: toprim domain-containing protein, partial [Thermodesulfobacteriota bacterium]
SDKQAPSQQIRRCRSVQHPALISYLNRRAIALPLARYYLQEVHYSNAGRPRFALGWRTDSGGWSLRAHNFKACFRPAGITTLGTASESLAVFEGMFDFLAALSFYRKSAPNGQVIILNSTAHLHAVSEIIKDGDFQAVRLYLDNDRAGRLAAQQLLTLRNTVDCSEAFSPAKDFAQWYEQRMKGRNSLSFLQ